MKDVDAVAVVATIIVVETVLVADAAYGSYL